MTQTQHITYEFKKKRNFSLRSFENVSVDITKKIDLDGSTPEPAIRLGVTG